MTYLMGWQCPLCRNVYSPTQTVCKCKALEKSDTTPTKTPLWDDLVINDIDRQLIEFEALSAILDRRIKEQQIKRGLSSCQVEPCPGCKQCNPEGVSFKTMHERMTVAKPKQFADPILGCESPCKKST